MNNQIKEAEQIRSQYTKKDATRLEQLRNLDRKVKSPADVFAYIFGSIGTLVLGTGMSFAMDVIGNSILLGIIIGSVGILIVSINYYIYKGLLNARKKKYAQKIIAVSDDLINASKLNLE